MDYEELKKQEEERKLMPFKRGNLEIVPMGYDETLSQNPDQLTQQETSLSEEQPLPEVQPKVEPGMEGLDLKDAKEPDRFDLFKQLQDAQAKRDKDLAGIGIREAGNIISSGLAGHGAKAISLEEEKKRAGQPVEDVMQGAKVKDVQIDLSNKESLNDPNSEVSQMFRSALKKAGYNVGDNVTAQQMKEFGVKLPGSNKYDRAYITYGPDGKPWYASKDPVTGETKLLFPRAETAKKDPLTGAYMRESDLVGRESEPSVPSNEQGKKTIDYQQLNSVQRKHIDDASKEILKDDNFKKNQERFETANEAIAILNSGATIPHAVATKLSKAAGQTGMLTEQDVKPYFGNQSIPSILKRFATMKTIGDLPQSDKEFLIKFTNAMKNGASNNIEKRLGFYRSKLSQRIPEADEASINSLLNLDELSKASSVGGSDKVKVKDPKTGRIALIPKEKLEEAKKRGLQLAE